MKWNDRIISTCLKGRERYFSLSWGIKPVLSNMYNTNAWYLHCNSRIRKLGRCWNIRHFDWYYLLASLVKPLSPKSQQCMVLVYTPNKHLKQKNRQSKEEFFSHPKINEWMHKYTNKRIIKEMSKCVSNIRGFSALQRKKQYSSKKVNTSQKS